MKLVVTTSSRQPFMPFAGVVIVLAGGCYPALPLPQDVSVDTTSGGGESGAAALDCAAETQWALEFLEAECGECHSPGGNAKGNFDYVTNIGALLTSGKIRPGDADGSSLYTRIESGEMPPPGAEERPSNAAVARMREWIASCTIETCSENAFIDRQTELAAMSEDVNGIPNDDRKFVRYFSFVHLWNAGVCDAEIEPYRWALSKLVNSLSTEPIIVSPKPIDDAALIYRVDIRDYGWDATVEIGDVVATKWDAIVAANAYAIEFEEDEAELVKLFTRTDIPFLMGDAFIAQASAPPLYHTLADIPSTLGELETRFGLDIAENIALEEVARAGVLDSGVSQQNRIVERHQIPTSFGHAIWMSYDFSNDSEEEQNIFSSPLDFVQAGGEVIFSLPNGLHGYMLVDAEGGRLDVAPDDIVIDPEQRDQNVRNGISCFSCHTQIIPAEDDVRGHVLGSAAFSVEDKKLVAALYPEREDLAQIQRQDTQAYHASLTAAGVPTEPAAEPILATFRAFEQNVDVKRAAAELGITKDVLLSQIGKLNPALQQLAETPVKRGVWESLFAETICKLNIGVTADEACLES